MAINIGKRIIYQTKRDIAERVIGEALGLLGNNPDKNAKYFLKAIDHIASGEKQAITRDWLYNWLAEGKPGREFLNRILHNIHPNVRRRYIARMMVSMFFRDSELIERCKHKYGVNLPATMLISPSMRCNYRCRGCYAASYERKDDMNPEVFHRVLSEAEDMGMNFFVILGGEPFIYPELLPIIKKHNKSFFQIYTNGFFLDKEMVKKLVELGNIAPQLSVNGPAEYTDDSRGKGAFDQAMQAMDNLREAGCVFGFSSLVTRHNIDAICSDEWLDLLVKKGALYGWYFLYMPVGDNPDMSLMPTPEQRNKLRITIRHCRQTKPILPADFWSDGAMTGGCIAGGRLYFHVNHRGDVEPCIFCHFATHNINDCSLGEALASPFFTEIRKSQPFSFNTLRPCPMIDHPQTMWGIIQRHSAKSTHPGAEKMFTTFAPEMKLYADKVEEIMDEVWDTDGYCDWAAKWMTRCALPPEQIETRRKEFEASRSSKKQRVTV
jgi:MoaA/NifB/PqqE/SkfB family radical SAM enzyme